MSVPCVLVLGYSGTMGQRIVRLLKRYLPDVQVIGASRSAVAVSDFTTRVLDLSDRKTYPAALKGVNALIHAAGPFDHDPTTLVQACIQGKIHYIDIAESEVFINKIKNATNETAIGSSAIVTGCSTVPGLVACLGQRFASRSDLARITVTLSLGSSNPVSHGLCFSLLRPLGRSTPDGKERWFRRFSRTKHLDGRIRQYANYPIPFDDTVLIGSHHIPISFAVGFDRTYINYALYAMSYLLPFLADNMLHRVCRAVPAISGLAAKLGGSEGRLTLSGYDSRGELVDTIEVKAAQDGLDIPAVTAVWAVQRLLTDNSLTGYLGLERLISANEVIEKLEQMNYVVSMKAVI